MKKRSPKAVCDEQVLKNMCELYNANHSYAEIAKKVNKSQRWVGIALEGHVTPRPKIRKAIRHEQIVWNTKEERDDLVVQLYQEGLGAHIISKKLGIGKRTVFRILAAKGIKTDIDRSSGKLNEAQIQTAIDLYNSGLSSVAIAQRLEVTEGAIRWHLKKETTMRCAADTMSTIPTQLQDEVIRLYVEDKLSTYNIAKKFDWTYQTVQKFIARKGLSPQTGSKEWKEAVQRGIGVCGSSLEKKLATVLDELNIDYVTQPALEEFRYDFGIGHDILIEVQGSFWHTKKQRRQRDLFKQKLAKKHGKKLLVIWDYQLANTEYVSFKILNAISPPIFKFDDLHVTEIDWHEAKKILSKWHYQGSGRSGHAYGVYYQNDIIAAVVFAKPTRIESSIKQSVSYDEIFELTRFIIHPKYQAKNFASWILSRTIKFVKLYHKNIKVLVSFSDLTFGHDGTIYKATNWAFDGTAPNSYWYFHRRHNQIYHKKTIWNAAKNCGMSESDYARSKSLLQVFGLPKNRYILRLR